MAFRYLNQISYNVNVPCGFLNNASSNLCPACLCSNIKQVVNYSTTPSSLVDHLKNCVNKESSPRQNVAKPEIFTSQWHQQLQVHRGRTPISTLHKRKFTRVCVTEDNQRRIENSPRQSLKIFDVNNTSSAVQQSALLRVNSYLRTTDVRHFFTKSNLSRLESKDIDDHVDQLQRRPKKKALAGSDDYDKVNSVFFAWRAHREPKKECVRIDNFSPKETTYPLSTLVPEPENDCVSIPQYTRYYLTEKGIYSILAAIKNPWTISVLTANVIAFNFYHNFKSDGEFSVENSAFENEIRKNLSETPSALKKKSTIGLVAAFPLKTARKIPELFTKPTDGNSLRRKNLNGAPLKVNRKNAIIQKRQAKKEKQKSSRKKYLKNLLDNCDNDVSDQSVPHNLKPSTNFIPTPWKMFHSYFKETSPMKTSINVLKTTTPTIYSYNFKPDLPLLKNKSGTLPETNTPTVPKNKYKATFIKYKSHRLIHNSTKRRNKNDDKKKFLNRRYVKIHWPGLPSKQKQKPPSLSEYGSAGDYPKTLQHKIIPTTPLGVIGAEKLDTKRGEMETNSQRIGMEMFLEPPDQIQVKAKCKSTDLNLNNVPKTCSTSEPLPPPPPTPSKPTEPKPKPSDSSPTKELDDPWAPPRRKSGPVLFSAQNIVEPRPNTSLWSTVYNVLKTNLLKSCEEIRCVCQRLHNSSQDMAAIFSAQDQKDLNFKNFVLSECTADTSSEITTLPHKPKLDIASSRSLKQSRYCNAADVIAQSSKYMSTVTNAKNKPLWINLSAFVKANPNPNEIENLLTHIPYEQRNNIRYSSNLKLRRTSAKEGTKWQHCNKSKHVSKKSGRVQTSHKYKLPVDSSFCSLRSDPNLDGTKNNFWKQSEITDFEQFFIPPVVSEEPQTRSKHEHKMDKDWSNWKTSVMQEKQDLSKLTYRELFPPPHLTESEPNGFHDRQKLKMHSLKKAKQKHWTRYNMKQSKQYNTLAYALQTLKLDGSKRAFNTAKRNGSNVGGSRLPLVPLPTVDPCDKLQQSMVDRILDEIKTVEADEQELDENSYYKLLKLLATYPESEVCTLFGDSWNIFDTLKDNCSPRVDLKDGHAVELDVCKFL